MIKIMKAHWTETPIELNVDCGGYFETTDEDIQARVKKFFDMIITEIRIREIELL